MVKTEIKEKLLVFKQLIKFGSVGIINTGVDFAVLNLLMWTFGINEGKWLIPINIVAFTLASANSYIFNKFWTFKEKTLEKSQVTKQFSQFMVISIIGAIINTVILYSIATLISPIFGLSQTLWTNFAKIAATGISMVWNFVGYKFFVFKK